MKKTSSAKKKPSTKKKISTKKGIARPTATSRAAKKLPVKRVKRAAIVERDTRFSEVIALIESARARAYQAVNSELVSLYWQLGQYISRKIASTEWGDGVVEALAADLARRYPSVRGYTRPNLCGSDARAKERWSNTRSHAQRPHLARSSSEKAHRIRRRVLRGACRWNRVGIPLDLADAQSVEKKPTRTVAPTDEWSCSRSPKPSLDR